MQCILDESKTVYDQNYETWLSEKAQSQDNSNNHLLASIGLFAAADYLAYSACCSYKNRHANSTASRVESASNKSR